MVWILAESASSCPLSTTKPKKLLSMSQYIIHQSLKYNRGICQLEQHKWILEMPQRGVKSRLPFITLLDVDQVIGIVRVQQ